MCALEKLETWEEDIIKMGAALPKIGNSFDREAIQNHDAKFPTQIT